MHGNKLDIRFVNFGWCTYFGVRNASHPDVCLESEVMLNDKYCGLMRIGKDGFTIFRYERFWHYLHDFMHSEYKHPPFSVRTVKRHWHRHLIINYRKIKSLRGHTLPENALLGIGDKRRRLVLRGIAVDESLPMSLAF